MVWLGKRADEIVEADIQELLDSGTYELTTLEYKAELPFSGKPDRREFLEDVSSFSNARGGYLLYGVPEKDGQPTKPLGLADRNIDQDKQSLENLIRDGIRPPIPGLSIHGVQMSDGRVVYVIHVPRSFNRPHQVVAHSSLRFYSRNSTGKYPLQVDELRSLFTYSAEIAERAREFQMERLGAIIAGDTPVPMTSGSKVVLHVAPLTAFEERDVVDPSVFKGHPLNLPISGDGSRFRFNFSGYLKWSESSEAGLAWSYWQGYRSLGIEAVDSYLLEINGTIPTIALEAALIAAVWRYLGLYEDLKVVDPPIIIELSLIGIRDRRLVVGREHKMQLSTMIFGQYPIDQDAAIFPELLIDKYPSDVKSVADLLRPVFDVLWNAAGFERCLDYDENGNFTKMNDVHRYLQAR